MIRELEERNNMALQIMYKDIKSRLHSCEHSDLTSAIEDFLIIIKKQVSLLSISPHLLQQILAEIEATDAELTQKEYILKDAFKKNLFSKCFEDLLNIVNLETVTKLSKEKFNSHLLDVILNGPIIQTFPVLVHRILSVSSGFCQTKCISLLEKYLEQKMDELLFEQCQIRTNEEMKVVDKKEMNIIWDELVLTLSTLPDKMAGKLQDQNSEMFYPNKYIRLLGESIIQTLKQVHHQLQCNNDCSLEFISRLIGKLCLTGYSGSLWATMLPELCTLVKADYMWCRICERIVTGVPDKCIESVLVPLLQKIPWFGLVDKFLGDCVLTNRKVQYLLCTKLLFHRYFDEIGLIQNTIGYLASSHTRRHLYLEVMRNLLNVWGDGSAIKHTSYSQHYFISKALMISLSHLSDKEKAVLKDEYIRLLMPAVQCHIGSPDLKLRKLGMVVAETITSVLDPKGPKLQFEYEKDKEIEGLLLLLNISKDEPQTNKLDRLVSEEKKTLSDISNSDKTTIPKKSDNKKTSVEELDSDDDLEPYDMSDDVKMSKVQAPKYIRDCMEGLICSEDPEKVEACLFTAESLIRKSPDGLAEIAAEFSKILLHLQDSFTTTGFVSIRLGAMVALAVLCPIEVSEYLTGQFYERNYNLRQRMDILEVLSSAAQELAKPVNTTKLIQRKVPVEEIKAETETWRDIVDKRIQSKTRRFIKGRSKPEPVPVVNRFTSVAGHFFFPLLKFYDRRDNSFDLLGEDCVVLRKYIFSLGIILYSAVHIPLAQQMCQTLLEFVWAIRYHSDSSVRQALLFCVSMIVLVLPSHCILTDLQTEIGETKTWLEETIDKDPDTECKKMAVQALVLLENTVKQGIQANIKDAT